MRQMIEPRCRLEHQSLRKEGTIQKWMLEKSSIYIGKNRYCNTTLLHIKIHSNVLVLITKDKKILKF